MNTAMPGLFVLAIQAAGLVLFAGELVLFAAQVGPGFPEYPPVSDADPFTRHQVEVALPSRLTVERTASRLSVSYDPASVRNVKIVVGRKMAIGIKDELRVYERGGARPVQARSISEGSIPEKEAGAVLSNPNILRSQESLNSADSGIPAAGKRYLVEREITVFETDIPPQHMWNPKRSQNFRVLWVKRLTAVG